MVIIMKQITGKIKSAAIFLAKIGVATWVLLLIIWGIASLFNSELFMPSPLKTLEGTWEIVQNGLLLDYVLVSLRRIFIGWFIGVIIAVPLGLLIGQFRPTQYILEPFINLFRLIPAVGFLSLFLMWFGIGEESKIALIVYATIFPTIINTITGVQSIDSVKYQAAASQGASKFQTFYSITIPALVPYIFTGLRLGLSGAIISIVAAEMLAAQEGIGYLIYTSRLYFHVNWIFAGILILGLIGYLSDKLLLLIAGTALKRYGVAASKK